jgi:hypothetical protein
MKRETGEGPRSRGRDSCTAPATVSEGLENGVTIQVPEFIPSGVRVRVNPNTGEYLDRAKD